VTFGAAPNKCGLHRRQSAPIETPPVTKTKRAYHPDRSPALFSRCRRPPAQPLPPASGRATNRSPPIAVLGFSAIILKDFGKGGRGSPALPYILLAGIQSRRGDDDSGATTQGPETGLSRNWVARRPLQSGGMRKRKRSAVIRPDVMPHPHLPVNREERMGKPVTGGQPGRPD